MTDHEEPGKPSPVLDYIWHIGKSRLKSKCSTAPCIGDLSGNEAQVMLILLAFANVQTLQGWPSVQTIALESDGDRRSVQRALRGLERKGYVKIAATGGGRYSSTWVLTRPPVVKITAGEELTRPAATDRDEQRSKTPPQQRSKTPPQQRSKTPPQQRSKTPPEHTIDPSIELDQISTPSTSPRLSDDDVVDCVLDKEMIRRKELRTTLIALGVESPTLQKLLKISGIYAVHAMMIWSAMQRSASHFSNPVGMLIRKLEAGPASLSALLRPTEACDLVNWSAIECIGGQRVTRQCRYNAAGIWGSVESEFIPADKLLITAIVMKDECEAFKPPPMKSRIERKTTGVLSE